MGSESPLGVFPLLRTEAQIRELRTFCELWRVGPERFWSFDDVLAALGRPGGYGLVAAPAEGTPWHGVLLCDIGPFSADMLYVFVRPEARRAGVGEALLAEAISELSQRPALEALFLEVRRSNTQAQALYRRHGMIEVGCRLGYYSDGEDALVLRRGLKPAGAGDAP